MMRRVAHPTTARSICASAPLLHWLSGAHLTLYRCPHLNTSFAAHTELVEAAGRTGTPVPVPLPFPRQLRSALLRDGALLRAERHPRPHPSGCGPRPP